jgi:hypothetical protein
MYLSPFTRHYTGCRADVQKSGDATCPLRSAKVSSVPKMLHIAYLSPEAYDPFGKATAGQALPYSMPKIARIDAPRGI